MHSASEAGATATTQGGARSATRAARSSRLSSAKPGTYEELRAVLSSGTIHFPTRLRQVAIFLWQHPNEVALGTINEVARQARVQPSTIVRFAQIFGFAGFSDFQLLFKQHIKALWSAPGAGNGPVDAARAGASFLHGSIEASLNSLARLAHDCDLARLDRIADLLCASEMIHVVGSKRAFPVACYLSLALSQQGVRNVLVDNVGSSAHDMAACARPTDAVLAVNFSPYNSITVELVSTMREHGARVAVITDSALSPLAPLADCWVEVVEETFAGYRSVAGSLVLGMAIVHEVASRRRSIDAAGKDVPYLQDGI